MDTWPNHGHDRLSTGANAAIAAGINRTVYLHHVEDSLGGDGHCDVVINASAAQRRHTQTHAARLSDRCTDGMGKQAGVGRKVVLHYDMFQKTKQKTQNNLI